ncbi:hypothetical protein [Bosea vestrisii]|uniref:Cobalamin-independent methionine synthase MetE C-terminal/archaeal domain-containing protein n=1 Tax=Bosea vestrisii TaxID=151416 RepID=A0ABW0H5S9_9HYPH
MRRRFDDQLWINPDCGLKTRSGRKSALRSSIWSKRRAKSVQQNVEALMQWARRVRRAHLLTLDAAGHVANGSIIGKPRAGRLSLEPKAAIRKRPAPAFQGTHSSLP